MRQGVDAARTLFKHGSGADWRACLELYETALKAHVKAGTARLRTLLKDDEWIRGEFACAALSRGHVEHTELVRVMRWKITCGTFRPLLALVESNSPQAVVSVTKQAIQTARSRDSQQGMLQAMDQLCKLKGIGPATASAVLAMLFPHRCAFMADEALEGVGLQREYTAKALASFWALTEQKGAEVSASAGEVSQALWTCAKLSALCPHRLPVLASAAESRSGQARPASLIGKRTRKNNNIGGKGRTSKQRKAPSQKQDNGETKEDEDAADSYTPLPSKRRKRESRLIVKHSCTGSARLSRSDRGLGLGFTKKF
eukprot:g24384.t1